MVSKTIFTIASVIAGVLLGSNILVSAMSAQAFAVTTTTLNGAGATFPAPLVDEWSNQYEIVRPQVIVSYSAVGSGTGIQRITNDLVEFGATDAPMNAVERAAAPGILHFPETAGGVVATYNIPGLNETELRLTGKILADIYLGNIRFWDDARIVGIQAPETAAKLTHNEIVTVHRSDSSGTTFVFTEYLSKVSSAWNTSPGKGKSITWPQNPPIAIGGTGNPGVTSAVQSNSYSIGYVELTYALSNDLGTAQLKNAAGRYVLPTLSSLSATVKKYVATTSLPAGDQSWESVSMTNGPGVSSYPITSFTYFLFYKESNDNASITSLTEAKELKRFMSWVNTKGQTFSAGLNYVPLPVSVKNINSNTLGMMTYNSAPLT